MVNHFKDTDTISKLLARYFDAVYRADVATLKIIFHPKASMNGFLGTDMLIGTPEPFFADLLSKPSMAAQNIDCRAVVTALIVKGNIASATLLVNNFFGVATVEDHFHLLKVDGEWRILCKTFTTL